LWGSIKRRVTCASMHHRRRVPQICGRPLSRHSLTKVLTMTQRTWRCIHLCVQNKVHIRIHWTCHQEVRRWSKLWLHIAWCIVTSCSPYYSFICIIYTFI
jgi:hypothetical protein